MKLFFFTSEYNVGGGERNLLDLAFNMKCAGHKSYIFIPKEGLLSEALKKRNILYFNYNRILNRRRWIKFIPLFIDIISFYNILKWCKAENIRPDVIHCNSIDSIPLAYILSKYFNVKLYWTCHGPWEAVNGFKSKVLERMIDKVIAITPEIYDLLACNNKVMIPLGIEDRNTTIASPFLLAKKRLVCIARFQRIKGQDIMVNAFKIIHEKHPDVELHFYGSFLDNNEKDRKFYYNVKNIVNDLKLDDWVVFHGYEENVREIMTTYDILCIPSIYESFSITAIEGMNRGMTIVAPDIGGPRYLITNNVNGLLFRPNDYEDLAKQCIKILQGDVRLRQNDIIKNGKKFTIKLQTEKLLKEYNL